MILLQLLSVIFGICMAYVVYIHRKKKHVDAFEYGIWLAIWSGFIFLALFPETVHGLAQRLSIIRVFDLLVIVSFMISIVFIFLNRIALKRLEKKFEDMTRAMAMSSNSSSKKHS